ncbi:hypothetical protein Tco_0850678 [Tanacetum coccineum]
MNPQEIQQVAARDEKWVPSAERVKINFTNIKLETTVPHKEETFQVVIDIIKNFTCFKDFTISADFPEIFMQQFWYTIKKVQDTDSYEFLLANKKYTINAEVFRTILDIWLRVEGVDFTDVLDDDIALTFLIDLGYKGPLNRHTNIIGEDYQEYGLPIPDVMLTDAIKRSESYQMFIKYSTNQIPPKKSRGKGSKGKKTAEEPQETVDVSEESEPEPEPAKKKTSSKRRVKKKATLSADDNIISDDLDVALELAKSISQTKSEEAEAARKVHATHARIMSKSIPESAKKKSNGRSSKSVVIQDTLSTPKSKPATLKTKLKGAPSLTPQEQEAADIMQDLKESKKTRRRQPGTGAKIGVPDEEKDITKDEVILEWGDEQDSDFSDDDIDDVEKDDKDGDADDEGDDHVSDTQDADGETESDKDEIYKYKIRVRKDEDVEMKDAEVEESDKGEEKVTDAAKEEAEKTSEAKDDTKKSELPSSSSSLSISLAESPLFKGSRISDSKDNQSSTYTRNYHRSSSFNCFPLSSSDTYYLNRATNTNTNPNTPITIATPTIITAVHESNALSAVKLRVAKLEKDVSELKTVDHTSEALAVLQSQVPTVVDSYLDNKVGDVFQKELQKHTAYFIHKYSLHHLPDLM